MSGSAWRNAAIVSGELTSAVSIKRAPSSDAISSNEHCPERSASIGPGKVTTATTSAPAAAAAARQSRPITSKLTQSEPHGSAHPSEDAPAGL